MWPYIALEDLTQGIPDAEVRVNTPRTIQEPQPSDVLPDAYFHQPDDVYHVRTRLPDGRPALLIDPGSVGNLGGDQWAKSLAQHAHRNGYHPSFEKRERPLTVSGVGHGSQSAQYDCKLPVAFRQLDGKTTTLGSVNTPTVSNSDLPGLLGLASLRRNRAIIDFEKLQLFFRGPGDYDLAKSLPPGTDGFQCELTPSGHLVLPCSEFSPQPKGEDPASSLTLLSRVQEELMRKDTQ